MGILDKLFGKSSKKSQATPSTGRRERPLGLVPLSREEERIQSLLAKEKKAGTGPVSRVTPPISESSPEPDGAVDLVNDLSMQASPPVPSEAELGFGFIGIQKQLRDIQSNLLNLDDQELDERLNQIIERLQAYTTPGANNGETLLVEDRGEIYDLMIETLSIAKFPRSRASLRPLLEMDLKGTISATQAPNASKALSHLNCKNILEIARLRELHRFFQAHPGLPELQLMEKVWEYQLTFAQFVFFKRVAEKYPSLRSMPEIFQMLSDAQIHYLAQNVLGKPEDEFRANLAKMRILRDRRAQEGPFQKAFEEQFRLFLQKCPADLRERLDQPNPGDFNRWVRTISTTIVEYMDFEASASGLIDRGAMEKDRWAVAQFVEKGMFPAVLEIIEKFKSRADQPRELAFEIQKRNTRYFSKHPPYWVAIVEVIARDRERVIIDGNLTGEGPLGGVPVQREKINVSERIKENLKGRDFSSFGDREIAEKAERAVQLLGRKLSQTGNFLTLFADALNNAKPPGPDELEFFPRSIRSIQTEELDEINNALRAEGKEMRPTEEEIVQTMNNLEPILDLYPEFRDKGGLEVFIYQRYAALKKDSGSPEEMQQRRRDIAERLNIAINQVLMPWVKRHRENIENAFLGGSSS